MDREEIKLIVDSAVGSAVGACLERFTLPTMFTVDEIAEKLKISKDIVNIYVRSGELKSVLLGARMIRIQAESVRKLMENLAIKGKNLAPVPEVPAEEQKSEEQKSEEQKYVSFVRCQSINPKSGLQCCLALGHEGKHKITNG